MQDAICICNIILGTAVWGVPFNLSTWVMSKQQLAKLNFVFFLLKIYIFNLM